MTVRPLNTSFIVNISTWCNTAQTLSRFSSTSPSGATCSSQAGIASTNSISPFTTSIQCGTANPTFTYSGIYSDSSALPSFMTIDPSSGAISLSSSSQVGNYSILVQGTLQNFQMFSAIFYLTVYAPPSLALSQTAVTINVKFTSTVSITVTDPNSLFVTISTTSLPNFISLQTNSIRINP